MYLYRLWATHKLSSGSMHGVQSTILWLRHVIHSGFLRLWYAIHSGFLRPRWGGGVFPLSSFHLQWFLCSVFLHSQTFASLPSLLLFQGSGFVGSPTIRLTSWSPQEFHNYFWGNSFWQTIAINAAFLSQRQAKTVRNTDICTLFNSCQAAMYGHGRPSLPSSFLLCRRTIYHLAFFHRTQ